MGTGTAWENPPSGFSQVTKLVPSFFFFLGKVRRWKRFWLDKKVSSLPRGELVVGKLFRHSTLCKLIVSAHCLHLQLKGEQLSEQLYRPPAPEVDLQHPNQLAKELQHHSGNLLAPPPKGSIAILCILLSTTPCCKLENYPLSHPSLPPHARETEPSNS